MQCMLIPNPVWLDLKSDFEKDFIQEKLGMAAYIGRLQDWRNKYEKFLDSRPRVQPLDLISHYLAEFHHAKIDEIEVPGQYLEVRTISE